MKGFLKFTVFVASLAVIAVAIKTIIDVLYKNTTLYFTPDEDNVPF